MKTRGSTRAPRGSTVYAATKHAITAVAVGLPMEVGEQSVRATSIEPGLVRTEFAGTSHGSAGDYYAKNDQREKAEFRYQTAASITATEADAYVKHAQMLVQWQRFAECWQ